MTASTDWPTAGNPAQPTNGGNYDVYVAVLNSGGTALDYSTYLGGSSTDTGRAIDFDADGNVYMAGSSASSNYPVENAEQDTLGGSYDFVRTTLTSDLSDIVCSTYYGGSGVDYGSDMAVGPPFQTRVAGSSSGSFPAVAAGSGSLFGPGGGYDGAIVSLNCGGAALAVANDEAVPDPTDGNRDCLTAGDFLFYNFDIENSGLSDQPDNPGPEMTATFTGPQVIMDCTASSGTCSVTSATSIEWNGFIASGDVVNISVHGRVAGGVPAGTELCLEGTLHFDPGTGDNEVTEDFEICTTTDCPPTVDPEPGALPARCTSPSSTSRARTTSATPGSRSRTSATGFSKAALVTWGEPGFCPPQCAGPLKVECSGLLKPGSTWNFLGAQVPGGSKSGILFSFTAKQLSEIQVDLGFDDITADVLCETLFFGVVGDCDDYRRFKKAYNEGLEFAGIPLDRAAGLRPGRRGPPALPRRRDPGRHGQLQVRRYRRLQPRGLRPGLRRLRLLRPLLYAQANDFNAIMYIQNGGLECSSVEIWFKEQDDCLRSKICEIFTLAPGETYQFDPNDCVGPDFQGSAWLRSSQPLAIAVDIIGKDVLMTYDGMPSELNYTFDPTKAFFTIANQVAYGPLVYSEYQGWDSGIQVQNFSSVHAAKVKVYFLDRSGDIVTTLIDWICPRGSQTFFLPVIADLPGNWVGSVRVESQEWWSPGDPLVSPPNIGGIATLIKYTDAARSRHVRGHRLQPARRAAGLRLADRLRRRRPRQRHRPDRHPEPGQGPRRHGRHHRDRHRQPGAEARLHRLRHLRLRPERPSRLRVREAEREAGRVHQPRDLGLREPRLQGLGHHLRAVLGARRLRRHRASSSATSSAWPPSRSSARARAWARTSPATRPLAPPASRSASRRRRTTSSSSTSRVRSLPTVPARRRGRFRAVKAAWSASRR